MPDLPVQEVRLPELHLPEIKREDIVRSLSGIHMPDVDLSKIERPRIDLPRIDLSSIDLGKVVAGATAAVHIGRRARRPRWPFALGALIVVGLTGWAILSNQAVRARLASGVNALRERISAVGSGADDRLEIDQEDAIAFDAAETAPIETAPYSEGSLGDSAEPTPYPDGLGNGHSGDEIPAFEESGRPA